MKKIFWILTLSCLYVWSATAQGIQFEEGNWKEVVEKAKKQNKLIYLDVFTTWCGPCKMMAKNIFPTQEAGDKYNELFINYKVDAEKGEGRTVAAQYAVSSYPTNLYINPHDESVVYRIAGACGIEEFLNRADIAMLDFSDPLSWDDYVKKLKANPKDYDFLMQYMGKAGRLGKSNDLAIDYYVDYHMSLPPHDSNIYFLVMATQTFDNKGYKILSANRERMDAMIQNPRDKFEEREKAFWFQNTFKKAVDEKDEKVLLSVRPILYKYNAVDSIGKWYWLMEYYYRTIDDKKKLMDNYKEAITYYTGFSKQKHHEMDSLMWLDNMRNLHAQYTAKRMSKEDIQKQLNAQQNRPEMSAAFTVNTINNIINGAELASTEFNKDKKLQKLAIGWCDAGLEIVDEHQPAWEKLLFLKTKAIFLNGKKKQALSLAETTLNALEQKKKDTKEWRILIDQINAGAL